MIGLKLNDYVGGKSLKCSKMINNIPLPSSELPEALIQFGDGASQVKEIAQFPNGSIALCDQFGENPQYIWTPEDPNQYVTVTLPNLNVISVYPNRLAYWALLVTPDTPNKEITVDKGITSPTNCELPVGSIIERFDQLSNAGFSYGTWNYLGKYWKDFEKGAQFHYEAYIYQRVS